MNSQHFLLILISDKQNFLQYISILMGHVLINFTTEEHLNKPPQNLSLKQAELFHADISSHLAPDLLQDVDLLSVKSYVEDWHFWHIEQQKLFIDKGKCKYIDQ